MHFHRLARPGRRQILAGTVLLLVSGLLAGPTAAGEAPPPGGRRLLYVANPGVRNYTEYGGHGLLVYDIDAGHKLLKRIPTAGLDRQGNPWNVKGVCASAATGRIYITTPGKMQAIDLATEKLLWEKAYDGGCDRMSITPDGKAIYLPSFESTHWNVVDGTTGDVITTITPKSGAHNTLVSLDGKWAYLAGLKSPLLTVCDAREHKVVKTVGPFGNVIRPFTINGAGTRVYVNVNELLGFEVGDVETGKVLARVEVPGFKKGPVKRHGCPSHGIGLTPDEKEIWLTDAHNQRLHVFDATTMPPKLVQSIELKDQPGWITFSIDGAYAYPSTGDVIDVKTRKIVTELKDEAGKPVQSEKMVEVQWQGDKVLRVGNQFGVGRVGG